MNIAVIIRSCVFIVLVCVVLGVVGVVFGEKAFDSMESILWTGS